MSNNGIISENRIRATEAQAYDRPIKPKHRLLNWVYRRPQVVGYLLDGFKIALKGANIPLLDRIHPFLKPANNHITALPLKVEINEKLQAEEVPMPPAVVIELIKRAGKIHVLDKCVCRQGRQCTHHSPDIGCMFLGDTGSDVVPQFSRRFTTQEAIQHVQNAVKSGLVPTTTRLRADHYAFLLPDHRRLLAICFCCDCCCFFGDYRHAPTERVRPIYPWIEGLEIEVTDDCTGCGACIKTCNMAAISVEDGRARFSEKCVGCGRCATTCPKDAVSIKATDPDYIQKTVDKFLSLAKID